MSTKTNAVRTHVFLIFSALLLAVFTSSFAQTLNSWYPLPTDPDNGMFGGYVRALANTNANPGTIYCGLKGGGIFFSENAAERWWEINAGLSNRNILSVVIDPDENNIVYAGTENGIFKSPDSGDSWQKIGLPNCHVNAIAIDPDDTDIIYAAVGNRIGRGYSEKGIWRSADGGEHWIQPDTLEHKEIAVDVYTVLIRKIGGKKKIIVGTSNGIWQSEDGLIWPDTSHVNNLWTGPVYAISVNPINTWDVYASRTNDVFFSSDGGDEFSSDNFFGINDKITCLESDSVSLFIGTESRGLLIKDISIRNKNYRATGLSDIKIYSILLDPNDSNIIYCATPQGVYKSEDRAATFQKAITGLTAPQVNQHLINPVNPTLFYAATTNGGFYSDDGGYSWQAMNNLPTSIINVLAANSETGNELFAGIDKDWVYYSTDWGVNWEKLPAQSGDAQKSIYSIVVDPVQSYLLLGAENGVFRSSSPYTNFELKLTTQSPVQTLILKPGQPDTIFAGTKQGKIFRGINNGDNWENVTNGFPPFSEIYDITCSTHDKKIVWGCTEKGLYRSENTGDRWDQCDAVAIEHQNIRQLIIDPARPGIMYVVTEDNGIYQSLDDGNTWRGFSEDLVNYEDIISHISFQPDSSNRLVASTLGKGMFRFRAEPIIHFATNPLMFGSVPVGKSDSLFSQVDNSGALPLIIDDVISSDPDVTFSLNSNVINPNSATDFSIAYMPQARGTLNCELFWKSNAFNSDAVLAVTGQGIAPEIIIGESCNDFGFTPINTTNTCSLSVENVGDADFEYTANFMNHPEIYGIAPASGVIPQNSVTDFEISFTPVAIEKYPDTLKLSSIDTEIVFYGDSLKPISGQGILGPGMELSATDHQFKPILPGGSDSWQFSIKNSGSEALKINDIRCDECPVFTAVPMTATIEAGSVVYVTVTFSSEDDGQFPDCQLKIYSNATFGDSVITLHGECIVNRPIIELVPNELDFGFININEAKIDSILVKNSGDALLEISDINWENPFLTLSDTSLSLDAGDSSDLELAYQPLDSDTLNEKLKFITNNAAGHDSVTVTGASVAPTIDMPDTLDFGLVLINTESVKEPEIENNGSAYFHGKATISGKDAQYFDIADTIITIPQMEDISTRVTFSPTEIGEHSANLRLESDTFFNGDSVVTLRGFCYNGPKISIEPEDSLVFPPTPVGSVAIKKLKVTNVGSDTLVIQKYFSGAGYFNENMDTTRLLAREKANITIYFSPDSNIRRPDTLRIYSNSYGNTLLKMPLIGYGIAPGIAVEPDRINFGDVNPGTIKRETVIIINSGNDTLNINDIYLEHEDSDYSLIIPDKVYQPILPDRNTEFFIEFHPNTVSPKSLPNSIIIKSDALTAEKYSLDVEGKCTDLEKPVIHHIKPDVAEKGQPITITAEVTDSLSGIENVWLKYRCGGVSQFKILVEMDSIEVDSFLFEIPGDSVTTRGVEYNISAEDRSGNDKSAPNENYFAIPVHVSGDGETSVDEHGDKKPQPGGLLEDSYRLFSVPLYLEEPDPLDVVADDLGNKLDSSTQRKVWRLVEYRNAGILQARYVFYNEGLDTVSHFLPGKSFFLIIREAGKVIDSGAGTSVSTAQVFKIGLKQGWNLIANPFNFAIPIKQVKLKLSSDKFYLWAYPGEWDTLSSTSSGRIKPWQGYAIDSNLEDTLMIYPHSDLISGTSNNHAVRKNNNHALDWKLRISAECNNVTDRLNVIGVSSLASDYYDKFDLTEPPGLGGIQLYMPHDNWNRYAKKYAFDIQSPHQQGNSWDFVVNTKSEANRIMLSFSEFESVPLRFSIQLIDKDRKIARSVREKPEYIFISESGKKSVRNFRIIVGTDDYITENNLGISSGPDKYSLSHNYPNPFNPTTAIYYQLPEMARVKIQIVNILGQVVKTLVHNEWKEAGTYTLVWDGCNEQQRHVSTGIYLCVFDCGKIRRVNKMILLK